MTAIHYIHTPAAYREFIESQPAGKRWGIDLETYVRREWLWREGSSALNPHTGGISLIALSDGRDVWVLDWLLLERAGVEPDLLFQLLSGAEYLVAANARFEAKWLLGVLGMELVRWRCVVIMSTLLANATGSKFGKLRGHSLQALCRDLLNVHLEGKGTIQTEDWWIRPEDLSAPWWQEKVAYAANDVRYLLEIHDQLAKVLETPFPDGLGQGTVLRLEMSLIPVIADMELRGLPVAKWLLERIQQELESDPFQGSYLDRVGTEILQELNQPVLYALATGRPVLTQEGRRLLNNPVRLRSVLAEYYRFSQLDNVQAEMLQRLQDVMSYLLRGEESGKSQEELLEEVCADEEEKAYYEELLDLELDEFRAKMPLLSKILTYRKLEKIREMDLTRHVDPVTGCIHASFKQCDASTGRIISSQPNVQQISGRTQIEVLVPRHRPFRIEPPGPEEECVPTLVTHRHCFVAPEGYSIVSVDYKSQEMLIAAVLSGDRLMLQSFSAPATKTVTLPNGEVKTYPNPETDLHLLTCKNCCFPTYFEGRPEHEWLSIAKKTTLPSGRSLRDVAKTINFGLIYLATPATLAKQVYAAEEEAARWKREHQRLYEGFWEWAHKQESLARRRGWARNQSTGRIRWVAEDNAKARGASPGRSGVNHLVQSTGADITKLAMVYLYQLFQDTPARLLKSIHDELVCLVPGTCHPVERQTSDGRWQWDWEPDSQVQEWMAKIRYWMEKAESQMLDGHPGFTEAKAAPFWWH